jgi:hypothetical protein
MKNGMLPRVAIVRTDVSKERIASIMRVTRIGKLGTTLEVTSNRSTLRRRKHSFSQLIPTLSFNLGRIADCLD